jgi:polygalacturonase
MIPICEGESVDRAQLDSARLQLDKKRPVHTPKYSHRPVRRRHFLALALCSIVLASQEASATPRVIYASQAGAMLDSDVQKGGGHDDTAALQAALDQALQGPLELVMDGAALVSGLTVHSHTTIRCLSASCGFFLKTQANRPILTNPHRTADPGAIVDEDIRLLGGTFNGNGLPDEKGDLNGHQLKSTREYSFTVALGFYGISDFTAAGITILHPRNYALHLANWRHVVLENDRVDVGVSDGINYDGIHFNGPGHDATVRNLNVHSWDDALAFNADDQRTENDPGGPSMSALSYGVPWIMNGPISDVVIDGLYLEHSLFGLRILSSASRVDRIAVRNIHGDARGWAITIDNFFGNFRNGPGNMGGITIENVDVHSEKGGAGRTNQYINIGCAIESLAWWPALSGAPSFVISERPASMRKASAVWRPLPRGSRNPRPSWRRLYRHPDLRWKKACASRAWPAPSRSGS